MSAFTQILYQLVFGSKDYTPFLTEKNSFSFLQLFSFSIVFMQQIKYFQT